MLNSYLQSVNFSQNKAIQYTKLSLFKAPLCLKTVLGTKDGFQFATARVYLASEVGGGQLDIGS